MTCPACSHRHSETVSTQVYRCRRCRAIHGTCYRGESYRWVRPAWHAGDSQQTEYVDLDILNGDGAVTRWHGWVDATSREIVQIG